MVKGRWCEVEGRASYKLDPKSLIPYEKEKLDFPNKESYMCLYNGREREESQYWYYIYSFS